MQPMQMPVFFVYWYESVLSYMFRECDIEVVVYHDLADAAGAPDATLGARHFSAGQPDFHLASTYNFA